MIDSLQDCTAPGRALLAVLSRFRLDFHVCLTARGDELFELANVVLCADHHGDRPADDRAGQLLSRVFERHRIARWWRTAARG